MAKPPDISGQHGKDNEKPDPQFLDHFYQLAITHEETLRRWEEEQEQEADPEMARKLAAMRTELLRRGIEQRRTE